MPDALSTIFISYAHADSAFVDRLDADLRQQGFDPWVDRQRLVGGQRWRRELQEAVKRAHMSCTKLSPLLTHFLTLPVYSESSSDTGFPCSRRRRPRKSNRSRSRSKQPLTSQSARPNDLVIAPVGSKFDDTSARGAHNDALDDDVTEVLDRDHAWIGWSHHGTLDSISQVLSHELLEIISDPEPDSGWQMNRSINGGTETPATTPVPVPIVCSCRRTGRRRTKRASYPAGPIR